MRGFSLYLLVIAVHKAFLANEGKPEAFSVLKRQGLRPPPSRGQAAAPATIRRPAGGPMATAMEQPARQKNGDKARPALYPAWKISIVSRFWAKS